MVKKKILISEISRTHEAGGDNLVDAAQAAGGAYQINNAKLYVPVITLSITDFIRFLENIKQRLK